MQSAQEHSIIHHPITLIEATIDALNRTIQPEYSSLVLCAATRKKTKTCYKKCRRNRLSHGISDPSLIVGMLFGEGRDRAAINTQSHTWAPRRHCGRKTGSHHRIRFDQRQRWRWLSQGTFSSSPVMRWPCDQQWHRNATKQLFPVNLDIFKSGTQYV